MYGGEGGGRKGRVRMGMKGLSETSSRSTLPVSPAKVFVVVVGFHCGVLCDRFDPSPRDPSSRSESFFSPSLLQYCDLVARVVVEVGGGGGGEEEGTVKGSKVSFHKQRSFKERKVIRIGSNLGQPA